MFLCHQVAVFRLLYDMYGMVRGRERSHNIYSSIAAQQKLSTEQNGIVSCSNSTYLEFSENTSTTELHALVGCNCKVERLWYGLHTECRK